VDTPPVRLTYLFSDVEGSTRLWERHPQAMPNALARHDDILRAAVEAAGGTVVKSTGDGMMAVFDASVDAVTAGLQAQRALRDEPWTETGPLRVRIGIHTGESHARAGDYFGTALNRTARVMAAGHGGQVLLTAPAATGLGAALPSGVQLRDLGTHRLKDLAAPERLFQVVAGDLTESFPPLATLDRRPNNLPTQTSAFLGRETVLEEVRTLLDADEVRLLTLTGPGGSGKTRLALQAAAEQVDRFEDGVYFVDLSDEREPDGAFAAIARVVGVSAASGEEAPLEALVRRLADAQVLLVLDNFEQVSAAAVGLIELLQGCPRVVALVTSREALRVRGERLFPVPPLTVPDPLEARIGPDDALESEAVALFVERAAAIRPDFALTDDNVADVVAICRRLDGLPLAIELAAARVNLFATAELRARLDDRLDVLRGGARDLPARQRTLHGAIAWSDDLLADDERTVLRLFSRFVGARLGDVEGTLGRVAGLEDLDVASLLGSLVDRSLVSSVLDARGRPRFSMLQTIRAYAAEQLRADVPLAAAIARAHAEHYTELAVDLRGSLTHTARAEVLAVLGEELGNLRAAWACWVEAGDVRQLNALLDPLWGYYDARGLYSAAVELGDDLLGVLALEPESPERVRDEIAVEMSLARSLIAVRGYDAEVERSIRAALDRAGDTGVAAERFPVLRSLATLHLLRADYVRGLAVGRELLTIAEQQHDPALLADAHLVVGLNTAFGDDISHGMEHLDRARSSYEAATPGLVKFRVGPSPGVVSNTASGLLLWQLGFPDRAGQRIARALAIAEELDHPYSRAYALYHAAMLDLWQEDPAQVGDRATKLLAISDAYDYPIWSALALVLRGTSRVATGEVEVGLADVERGFQLYRGMSTPPVFWPALLIVRATACAIAGRLEEAAPLLDEAEAKLLEDDFQVVGLAILRGDVLLAGEEPDPVAADAQYVHATRVALATGARMSHLVALTRLVRLRRGSDGQEEVRRELEELLDSLTEGHAATQVVAARAALAPTTGGA
jgi:predicted ATPase/class 3 adenylate cyclase